MTSIHSAVLTRRRKTLQASPVQGGCDHRTFSYLCLASDNFHLVLGAAKCRHEAIIKCGGNTLCPMGLATHPQWANKKSQINSGKQREEIINVATWDERQQTNPHFVSPPQVLYELQQCLLARHTRCAIMAWTSWGNQPFLCVCLFGFKSHCMLWNS